MSKWYTFGLHYVIAVIIGKFDYIDRVMRAFAMLKTQSMEEIYFRMKVAQQTQSKSYPYETAMVVLILIPWHILDRLLQLSSFRKCDKLKDENPQDEVSYTN
jgi:hypothetical protein